MQLHLLPLCVSVFAPSSMASLYLAFPMLFFLFSFSFSSTHSLHHDDGQSLLSFKNLITSDPHHSMADWNPANPFCNWTAVTCSRRHPNRVVALDLSVMDLRGPISPSLANLSFLRSLRLSGNTLHGHIPLQLGRLFRLRELYLDNNQLEGNIPNQLRSCRNLTLLALSFNNLTGNIPAELGSLPHLQELYLGDNDLTGTIPSSLGSLPHLQELYLEGNGLTGTIPSSFGNLSNLIHLGLAANNLIDPIPPQLGLLTRLQSLNLRINKFSHTIPVEFSNISTLTHLDMSMNHIIGIIPHELGLLTRLQVLFLFQNELSGNIPPSLSNISTLTHLIMAMNHIIGIIPHELGLITRLQVLSLFENELSGNIPPSLSNMFNLSMLYLWGNQLSGNIPNSIGNCSKLTEVILSYNMLSGSVPIEFGKLFLLEKLHLHSNQLDGNTMHFLSAITNCSHLQHFVLRNNKLSGVLPPTIGQLSTNLSILFLSNNRIQGNIPPHIGNLSGLTFLDLSENLLNGNIPQLGNLKNIERLNLSINRLEGNMPNDFEQLQHLGLLDMSWNMLSGKISNSFAPLKQLRRLHLHHNHLSGSIPANLGDCKNLELLDLSHNLLTGSIPREILELYNLHFYLNLSWNSLNGSLPKEIGKIAMAQAIDISVNQLTGTITPTLGSCSELQSLNLSQNAFKGSIPDSLGNLQSLVNLDLSSNTLSGTIPVTLKKLKMLQCFNLSFNNLMGEIPNGFFFANQTIVISLIGNPSLCGPQAFQLTPCQPPRGHFPFLKRVLLPMSGVIAFILVCLVLGFLWKGKMHMQNFDSSEAISQKLEHQRISYQELHVATNGFSEANLLGTSSFGLVYKGILSDGTLVVVKVLQLQNDQVDKSFKAECGVLKNVRHRNLVKIITTCSNLHFKGLVFQFMSNGSLEKHLYPNRDDNNGEDVCELGLKTRLDIAIDVAHAMEYLHHYSYVQVVHCDIKPSNVLLDEDMTGRVTDFGIARLIGASSSDSLTSTLALKGSTGYIAPEYGLGERISTKGDVYSYGILLLEMLTRKRPTSDMFVGDLNLHKWVSMAFPIKVKEVLDNNLFGEVDGDEFEENNVYKCMLSLLRVGLVCSKDSPQERPTMREVVMVMESLREDLVGNAFPSMRLKASISNLLSSTNATRNDALPSNGETSTF